MKLITRVLALVTILITITTATANAAPPARYECDDLEDYRYDLMTMLPTEDLMTLDGFLGQSVESMTPRELREMSRITDDWAAEMEDYPVRDIPYAARDYHEAFTETISLVSVTTGAIANGGLFAALPYMDLIDEIDRDLSDAIDEGERMCGALWPFVADEETI